MLKKITFLNYIIRFFPHIFGPGQNEPLDREGPYKAFQELSKEVSRRILLLNISNEILQDFLSFFFSKKFFFFKKKKVFSNK